MQDRSRSRAEFTEADLKISIAGAGIGGLSAATAFAQRGHSVRVLEQAPEIGEVGAGLQISPNGMAVLSALDCAEAMEKASVRADAIRLIVDLYKAPS